MPIKLVHVYSHAVEKLADPKISAEKKARIQSEFARLEEQEGCLQKLVQANQRADDLAR